MPPAALPGGASGGAPPGGDAPSARYLRRRLPFILLTSCPSVIFGSELGAGHSYAPQWGQRLGSVLPVPGRFFVGASQPLFRNRRSMSANDQTERRSMAQIKFPY